MQLEQSIPPPGTMECIKKYILTKDYFVSFLDYIIVRPLHLML